MVNVDAVVTDDTGLPVLGLTREDFRLFEDGREVEISNFLAVDELRRRLRGGVEGPAGGPPALGPPLHLVVFLDNANLRPSGRRRALAELEKLLAVDLASARAAGARVLLASNDRALVLRDGFVDDRAALAAALDELGRGTVWSSQFDLERAALVEEIESIESRRNVAVLVTDGSGNTDFEVSTRVPSEVNMLLPRLRLYCQQHYEHVRASLRVLTQLVGSLAGLPGPRAVLYVAEGLPLRPGEALFDGYVERFALRPGSAGLTSPETEMARCDATRELVELVELANASGVTFYTLEAAAPAPTMRGAAMVATDFWTTSRAALEEHSRRDSLAILADGTGGREARAGDPVAPLLTGLLDDFASRYSLGYLADPGRSDQARSIRVEVRGDGLEVRHRRSFRGRNDEERLEERTLAALLGGELANPLAAGLEAGEGRLREDGRVEVAVRVGVPMERLLLLPDHATHRAQLSLAVAARDERGRISPVVRHLCPLQLPNSEVLLALGRTAVCGVRLVLHPGRQTVAVAVRDELSAADSALRLELDLPSGGGPEVQ